MVLAVYSMKGGGWINQEDNGEAYNLSMLMPFADGSASKKYALITTKSSCIAPHMLFPMQNSSMYSSTWHTELKAYVHDLIRQQVVVVGVGSRVV